MTKSNKNILLKYILAPLLLVLFLYLVYYQIQSKGSTLEQWSEFKNQIQTGKLIAWLILVTLLAPVNWLIESVKWQFLLKKIQKITKLQAFISVLSGIALGFVTPNKIGDFLGRVLIIKNKRRFRAIVAAFIGVFSQWTVSFFLGLIGMIYLHFKYPANWTLIILLVSFLGLVLLIYSYFNIALFSKLAARFRKFRIIVVGFYLLKRYSQRELLKVLFLSLCRFLVYNLQFIFLLMAFDPDIDFISTFLLSGLMFWLITIMPTFFVADIGVRGFITGLVFIVPGIFENAFPVLAASYLIWIINTVLPAVLGSFFVFKKGVR